MKKRKLSVSILLGALLILGSLGLTVFFQIQRQLGAQNSQLTYSKLSQILTDRAAGTPGGYAESLMPVLELEGTDYVALLEIPALGVALPVADRWDSNALSRSPARFTGSAYDHTLVIGGADDPKQFGFCDQIDQGASLTVTDMTGAQFSYRVIRVDRSKQARSQWLTEGDQDLTLFCRDLYSMEYLAVRCEFAY